MVLHMPIGYTEMYAQKLERAVRADRAWRRRAARSAAPGHRASRAGRPPPDCSAAMPTAASVTHLDMRPLDTPHRPSVDVLFQSAADVYGAACARRRDDRDGRRTAARGGLDQGAGGPDPDRGRRELRRLRDAALGRRGRAQRRAPSRSTAWRGRIMERDMRPKILVVDDSGLARRGTRRILEGAGYERRRGGGRHGRARTLFHRQAGPGAARPGDEGHVRARRADQAARARRRGAGDRAVGRHPDLVARDGQRRRRRARSSTSRSTAEDADRGGARGARRSRREWNSPPPSTTRWSSC